jgi:hypothetical protein
MASADNDPTLPPPMTPEQFIRLLEEMCIPALARKSKRYGEVKYSITRSDIEEAYSILSGDVIPSQLNPD